MSKTEMRYSASPAAIESARENFLSALDARKEREAGFEKNESMLSFLGREAKHWQQCDAFTLGYAAATGVNPAALYLHERHGGEMFNIYAMPKVRAAMRVLNGARFPDLADSDAATLAGTIIALASGKSGGKEIANALNDYMNGAAGRVNYGSGATQSGSSLRALEALGIVVKEGARNWKVSDPENFRFLRDAAKKAKRALPVLPLP